MRQPLFVKETGITEKRIDFIERVVSRLARRTKNRSSVIMTPYPISSCVIGENVSGPILRYLFCADGKIGKFLLSLDSKPKDGAELDISIKNITVGEGRSFQIANKDTELEPELSVSAGDKLTISIKPLNEEKPITEAWVSFLWTPTVKEAKVKQFLIDDLLNGAEDERV